MFLQIVQSVSGINLIIQLYILSDVQIWISQDTRETHINGVRDIWLSCVVSVDSLDTVIMCRIVDSCKMEDSRGNLPFYSYTCVSLDCTEYIARLCIAGFVYKLQFYNTLSYTRVSMLWFMRLIPLTLWTICKNIV